MPAAGEDGHWDQVWTSRDPTEVSWFEATPRSSLAMIDELTLPTDAPILDLGGGASGLAGELLRRGYSNLTVADISIAALEKARGTLGREGKKVNWVVADVRSHDFGRRFALWHDRAVFHFMTEAADRERYLRTLRRTLEPKGHLIVATFGPDGPTSCSGVPVARYDAEALANAFAPARLVSSHLEDHETPFGNTQQLLYAHLRGR